MEELAVSAKKDFAGWCKAFADYVLVESVAVNFYLGDALSSSQEVASLNHIIDTSNIVDFYGHFNILHGIDYMLELGPKAVFSSVSGKNKKRLTISKVPPQESQKADYNKLQKSPLKNSQFQKARLLRTESFAVALQATYNLSSGTEETKALQNGALATLSDVSPCSCCSVLLNATTTTARKIRRIQVDAPVAPTLKPGGYDSNPFPVTTSQSQQPAIWWEALTSR
ncbi:hypothetical protein DSL72_003024 [Monilinia vaccinii-corymbosi]|uniref:Uncharacterized protein n=1 Tax=Monilinia vaccinii-corymbosi TaxID=61207 RepID=A0A8A3P027_9HELO|nr:hypothetical protein DSL72_003024 [Monilinia vaccinii-corymbosi]